MSRRDLTIKWLLYAALTLPFLAIQQYLLNPLEVLGVHPFIIPLLGAMVAIFESRGESAFFSVALGILCDLLMPSVIPCFYTLSFLTTALLVGLLVGRVIMPGFLCAFICSTIACAINGFLYLFFLIYSVKFAFFDGLNLIGLELALSLPAAVVLFPLYRWLYRGIHNE
ncbi:MAG: hypothetical protein IKV68_03955 [Oscillospiraceae bacterium]|nr:hypothetical protein [Oscillospiraceae bacterium]